MADDPGAELTRITDELVRLTERLGAIRKERGIPDDIEVEPIGPDDEVHDIKRRLDENEATYRAWADAQRKAHGL